MYILTQIFLTHLLFSYLVIGGLEEEQGVKYANKCEGNYIYTYVQCILINFFKCTQKAIHIIVLL